MTNDELKHVDGDECVIARLHAWSYGMFIAAAAVAITVYRILGDI